MSDVSKTSELIAEAREFLAGESAQYYDSSLIKSLADALEAAARVPVQGEPNEPTGALALVEEVIAIHADRIGTHYEDCYKYHVACLAVAVRRWLGGESRGSDI